MGTGSTTGSRDTHGPKRLFAIYNHYKRNWNCKTANTFFFTPECNNHNNFFNYIELFSCHSYQQEVSPAQPEEASNMHALNRFGQRGAYALFKQAS